MIQTILKIINKGIYFIGLSCVLGIIGLLLLLLGIYVSNKIHYHDIDNDMDDEDDDFTLDEDIMNEEGEDDYE